MKRNVRDSGWTFLSSLITGEVRNFNECLFKENFILSVGLCFYLAGMLSASELIRGML